MQAKSSWLLLLVALGLAVPASAGEETKKMIVTRSGAHPAVPGPAEYFTGTVRVQYLFPVADPSRVSAASVTFEPGARSAWHVHPAGQTLVVTSGTGWIQEEGGQKQVIRAGDIIWTPPGVKHWHGATATEGITHVAIQESVNGTPVHWMEKVTDEQYGR